MADSSSVVLITGGTGFLGWYLAQRVLRQSGRCVAFLVRAPNEGAARRRVEELFVERLGRDAWDAVRSRIEACPGDIVLPALGLSQRSAAVLAERTCTILHSAALTDFDKPYEEIRRINTSGTEHVLEFAESCQARGGLESVAHISTVAVAGTHRGVFCEDDLSLGQAFHNTYERSKFEAEILCLEYRRRGLNVNIFRPSIIIGDSVTGFAGSFKVIYQPIQIFSLGIYSEIPADDSAEYNIVPVDAAADAIHRILEAGPRNGVFHITNPRPVAGSFVFGQAAKFFRYRDPRRIPSDRFDHDSLRGFRRKLLEPYIPYFNLRGLTYDNRRAMEVLQPTGFAWPAIDEDLLRIIFQHCLETGFVSRNGGVDDERR